MSPSRSQAAGLPPGPCLQPGRPHSDRSHGWHYRPHLPVMVPSQAASFTCSSPSHSPSLFLLLLPRMLSFMQICKAPSLLPNCLQGPLLCFAKLLLFEFSLKQWQILPRKHSTPGREPVHLHTGFLMQALPCLPLNPLGAAEVEIQMLRLPV